MSNILISPAEAEEIKARFIRDEQAVFELKHDAAKRVGNKLYSVVEHPSPAASGNVHDYFSEGPYWWPDPKNPDGPYIRRDGEYNPNTFKFHRSDMSDMSKDVLMLAMEGFYLNEEKYPEKAYRLLKTWFIDEQTRMNPHLEYSQSIRGICTGRGIGIIDTVALLPAVLGAWYLEQCGYREKLAGCREWFARYLYWMNHSQNGMAEKNYHNNHANWWNTQAAAFAAYIGDGEMIEECVSRFKEIIIPGQLGSRGEFTDELTRTNSFTYSFYNLTASALMCEIALHHDHDLWHFADSEGKGMRLALEFMVPYAENPFTWEHRQIHGHIMTDELSFQLGAKRLGMSAPAAINRTVRADKRSIRFNSSVGPTYFFPGYEL